MRVINLTYKDFLLKHGFSSIDIKRDQEVAPARALKSRSYGQMLVNKDNMRPKEKIKK